MTIKQIRVDAEVYDQGVETLKYWAGLALLKCEWRHAAQLTEEAHVLQRERRRLYGREGELRGELERSLKGVSK